MTDQYQAIFEHNIPYSEEAERAVLGSVLIDPPAFLNIAAFLHADDFYLLRHAYIWTALQRLNERGDIIDNLTLENELRELGHLSEVGGPAYVTQLINSTPSSVHAEVYGRIVERASMRRRLLTTADEIKALALDEEKAIEKVTQEAETKIFSITEQQSRRDFIPMRDAISQYFDDLERIVVNQEAPHGLPTGFRDLDALLGGLQKSDLVIFAGRPGMGKCVAEGTLVPTERGLVPIESLKPRDIESVPDDEGGVFYPLNIGVQSPDGMRQTSHFYDSGVRPTLKITTRAGYTLAGTHPHPVLTISNVGQYSWKSLSELRSGDYVITQRRTSVPKFTHDEIVSIEDAGSQHCYDLTVPDGHAFVTNGIVSHNTSFILSTALNAARLGARIGIFSMEMGVEQIVQRFVSMETGINTKALRTGQLGQHEWARFVQASHNLVNFRIYIDDSPAINPLQMRTKCRRLASEQGLDLIVVDYMQLMNAGGMYENNRVQEISFISRSLKELARELKVPVFSAAQLSRAVEQRADKRPQLSDLRESGCLAGDALIYLPDIGTYVPIDELVGQSDFRVLSLNTETWKLEPALVTKAFSTGVKPVYSLTTKLGRSIRATANHKFLTIRGWKRLDELLECEHVALPRKLTGPTEQTMRDAELALLGHLIGDGCTLPNHAIQYTTREEDLAEIVSSLATEVFDTEVLPRIHKERGKNWYQVFLSASKHLTHGVKNPITNWMTDMDVFGLRSHEKIVPGCVFQQSTKGIALFLRHLWATDGCLKMRKTTNGYYPTVYYASSSEALARDVQALLLRLHINARIKRLPQNGKGRVQFHVRVSGASDLAQFVAHIGAVGAYKNSDLDLISEYLSTHSSNTNRDIIPNEVWRMYAVPSMQNIGLSTRQMQKRMRHAYNGTALYKQNISRERASSLAKVVDSEDISHLANSDVYWDQVASIEYDSETLVYDLTVPGPHNFISNNIIAHNSIEQDSDVVMFLYRDEVYNEATEFPNQADIIIAKHRNGPTGNIQLYFEKSITKFMDARSTNIDLRNY